MEYWPGYFEAWNNLGVTLIAGGKGREAVDVLTVALELNPRSFNARVNLGNALNISGLPKRAERAKQQYEAAMQLNPGHRAPVFNMGLLLLGERSLSSDEIKGYEAARGYLVRSLRLAGAGPSAIAAEDYIGEIDRPLAMARGRRKAEAGSAGAVR